MDYPSLKIKHAIPFNAAITEYFWVTYKEVEIHFMSSVEKPKLGLFYDSVTEQKGSDRWWAKKLMNFGLYKSSINPFSQMEVLRN